MTDFTALTNAELMTRAADVILVAHACIGVLGVRLDGDVGADCDALITELRSRAGRYA